MKLIELTQEDLDCNFTHRFELNGYYIEVFMTIFGVQEKKFNM